MRTRMMTQDEGHNKDFVQALANGLDVLAAFGPKPRELTIAQLPGSHSLAASFDCHRARGVERLFE